MAAISEDWEEQACGCQTWEVRCTTRVTTDTRNVTRVTLFGYSLRNNVACFPLSHFYPIARKIMKTTSPIVQRHYLHSVFTRPPVFDVIFRELSPASLIRTGRTCRVARDAVSNFHSRAFNINRHLSRFFSDPIAFRSLQARTGSLISGSSALQFLDRTFYPDSDLDIYVHSGPWALEVGQWLQSEGYIFIPNSLQSPEFNGSDWFRFEAERVAQETGREATEVDLFHIQHYRIRGVISVFSFEKQTGGHSDKAKLRVQIIVGKHSPLSAILCFHSSA